MPNKKKLCTNKCKNLGKKHLQNYSSSQKDHKTLTVEIFRKKQATATPSCTLYLV
ncbi:hypothetical protein HanLR1_Chr14g0536611 [Helianthus annuus]|nr:hypothetical protein HanHA89_Chr14g0574201 [Helianthus annuus]KAJ0656509.1 hypothetical protein HanLR1_Chr14g0536611 [Helianthus annuus]